MDFRQLKICLFLEAVYQRYWVKKSRNLVTREHFLEVMNRLHKSKIQ